jgi:hypothetical protein
LVRVIFHSMGRNGLYTSKKQNLPSLQAGLTDEAGLSLQSLPHSGSCRAIFLSSATSSSVVHHVPARVEKRQSTRLCESPRKFVLGKKNDTPFRPACPTRHFSFSARQCSFICHGKRYRSAYSFSPSPSPDSLLKSQANSWWIGGLDVSRSHPPRALPNIFFWVA